MKFLLAFLITIFQFIFISTEFNGKRDLIFEQIVPDEKRTNNYVLNLEPLEVDAFHNNQVLVIVNSLGPFKFFCRTSKLKPDYPIVKAFLCLKKDLTDVGFCADVQNNENVNLNSTHFSVKYDPLTGFEAAFKPAKSQDLHGFLYCTLENSMDKITSNNIELQSTIFYRNVIGSSFKIDGTLQKKNLRDQNIFDCGQIISENYKTVPGWIKPILDDKVGWFVCPRGIREHSACIEPIWNYVKKNEQYHVLSNYSLQLLDGALDEKSELFLECRKAEMLISRFHIEDDRRKSLNKIYPFKIYSQRSNSVEIRGGNVGNMHYTLDAVYQSQGVTSIWQKNNGAVSKDFKYADHVLTFPLEIELSHQGKYTLDVSQKYPARTAYFEYFVNVVSTPRVMEGFDVPNVVYVMSGNSLNLTTRLTGKDIQTSVEINDFPISINDLTKQNIDFLNFKKKYPYLSKMAIYIKENKNRDYNEIIYTTEKIEGLWFKKAYSHRITFIATNSLGTSRISTLIKAIEKPRWKIQLNKFDCTEKCLSNEPHYFQCAIFKAEYTEVGLRVKYQWRINGIDIGTLFSDETRDIYFTINDESLTINKISTENNVRDLRIIEKLQNATLSCSASILIPRKGEDGVTELKEMYNTLSDPSSMIYSQAMIRITMVNVLQGGSNILIWVICIPLIVITIITTITVCACYFGRAGKTYDIDQNERFAGKDPEQEIFDTLYFKHYTREEDSDEPIVTDHISWSDKHSGRHNMGELDQYDTENENFDEGSIVGQYADEGKQ